MKANQTPWTPEIAHKMKSKIDPAPQYQRGSFWTRKQKQLLIDSIFRGTAVARGHFYEAYYAVAVAATASQWAPAAPSAR